MNAISPSSSRHIPRRQTCLVIVRANAPLFYSLAIASFLEAEAAQSCAARLEWLPEDAPGAHWLRTERLAQKSAHAAALREYIEQCWPEFDWPGAFEQFRGVAQEGERRPGKARRPLELVGACASTAQAGLYYRALASWSDDHGLRALARNMADEEAVAFERMHEVLKSRAVGGAGLLASWRAACACVRHARDVRVQGAFNAILAHCGPNVPFPVLSYKEFVERMRSVIDRCARPIWPERVVFGAWRREPPILGAETQKQTQTWFKPVLAQAA